MSDDDISAFDGDEVKRLIKTLTSRRLALLREERSIRKKLREVNSSLRRLGSRVNEYAVVLPDHDECS